MNYIVLDMEWNQPGYADKTLCRNGVCMKNEIIQIGAVKLDEKSRIVDRFNVIVKPQSITSMNKIIKQLTGITDEMLQKGESFESAVGRFSEWCGNDFVILIWGYDDIRILKNNLSFFGLDCSWLPKSYNLQMIFCSQTDNEKRQYSLSYALEYFHIEIDAGLHDALNDAEYTALVCAKLDLTRGIKYLETSPSETRVNDNRISSLLIKRKFRNLQKKEDIWSNGFISRPVCPYCGGKMKFEKPTSVGAFRYNIKALCPEHGTFMLVLRFSKTPLETFSVCQQIYILNDETKDYFEKKARPHRRRRRSSSKNTVQEKSDLAQKELC